MKNGILKYPNIKIKAFYHQLTEPHVLLFLYVIVKMFS